MTSTAVKDKTILVTGAAGGLGRSMAKHLAELGANLILSDLNGDDVKAFSLELANGSGTSVVGYQHDVSCEDSWKALYEEVVKDHDELHGLVNNAGIMLHIPLPMTTLEQFRATQRINVDSVFIGIQTFLPLLKEAGSGKDSASIVNVSSIYGQVAGPMHSAYCASKGAVRLLTKSAAAELPRLGYNIRCNSIHPGGMDTGVGKVGLQAFVDAGLYPDIEQVEEAFNTTIPMGRLGRAEEIAAGVAFLLSPASSLMTGSELTLDGGATAV